MFSDNLDFIMQLTDTQASTLGHACHLNPSYISRLRNGNRPLPKNPTFLNDMSRYLARHITTDYQKSALCSTLNLSVWPSDMEKLAMLIKKWLVGDETNSPDTVTYFADSQPNGSNTSGEASLLSKSKNYYYGNVGKREAVLHFFDMILKEKSPQTLYLFSDEEMDWLYADPAFAAKWTQIFTEVLKAGNRVKMIHSIRRDMNEMLEGVSKWIPIYMTGMIEPYYYPKFRDSILRRTLFLAPKTAAIVSVSVGRQTEGMLNELITDREAVKALAEEFEHYLALCLPLMHILESPKTEELWKIYDDLTVGSGKLIFMSDRPTLATMPEQVAIAMQARMPGSCILERWKSVQNFINRLSADTLYTEILSPQDPSSKEFPFTHANLLDAAGLCYTPEEWLAHCENSMRFAQTHSNNYRQYLQQGLPKDVCVLIKENRGFIMTKCTAPVTAFISSEMNIVNSFWEYLMRNL